VGGAGACQASGTGYQRATFFGNWQTGFLFGKAEFLWVWPWQEGAACQLAHPHPLSERTAGVMLPAVVDWVNNGRSRVMRTRHRPSVPLPGPVLQWEARGATTVWIGAEPCNVFQAIELCMVGTTRGGAG